jgi:hypothetical protein
MIDAKNLATTSLPDGGTRRLNGRKEGKKQCDGVKTREMWINAKVDSITKCTLGRWVGHRQYGQWETCRATTGVLVVPDPLYPFYSRPQSLCDQSYRSDGRRAHFKCWYSLGIYCPSPPMNSSDFQIRLCRAHSTTNWRAMEVRIEQNFAYNFKTTAIGLYTVIFCYPKKVCSTIWV